MGGKPRICTEDGRLGNEIRNEVARNSEIFAHVTPNENHFVSDVPAGFCIDGALLTGNIGTVSVGVNVQAFGVRNVEVYIGTSERDEPRSANAGKLPTSFETLDEERELAKKMHGTDEDAVASFLVLQKQRRSIAGFPGEAVAYRLRYNDGRFRYSFFWDTLTNGVSSAEKPIIAVQLDFLDEGANYEPRIAPPPEADLLAL